jgi:hypothetical protein
MKAKVFETSSLNEAKVEMKLNEFLGSGVKVIKIVDVGTKIVIIYE